SGLQFCIFVPPAHIDLYTLSLHDALPILQLSTGGNAVDGTNTILFNLWATAFKVIDESDKVIANAEKLSDKPLAASLIGQVTVLDRKSTRLDSSHVKISYAVFCMKKKMDK